MIAAARSCDYPSVPGTPSAARDSVLFDPPIEAQVLPDRDVTAVPERNSDPVRLRNLFHEHYASVWRLLRRFGVQSSLLDDAAQEVFWVSARRLADIEVGKE